MTTKNEKRKMLFAFYVSGGASRLIKLLEKRSPVIDNTILIINDNAPNRRLAALLSERKINYVEIDFAELGLISNEKNVYISKLLLEKFKECDVDYCFCFGGRILKGDLLNIYKNRIINFHPSILPSFPGIKSIDQAINSKSFLLGNTAHFIDEGTDTGPVIMQSIIHGKNYSNYESVLGLQLAMLEQIYSWLLNRRLIVAENKVIIKDADYTPITFYPKLEIK